MLQKNKAVPQWRHGLLVCGWEPFGLSFFGNNLESNLSGYILVKFHGSFVSANFLDILEDDALTIHFDTELSEFFGDVEVRNRTIDGTGALTLVAILIPSTALIFSANAIASFLIFSSL